MSTSNETPRARETSTTELTKNAVAGARDLVQAEVAVVRQDTMQALTRMKRPAALFGLAGLGALTGAQLLVAAFVAAARRHPIGLVVAGAGCLAAAGALGVAAVRALPREELAGVKESLERVVDDARLVKNELTS